MVGALLAGILLQKFGRKMTLLISVMTAFISFVMLATSDLHEIPAIMIVARVLQGMSVGFSMAAATIYVSLKHKYHIFNCHHSNFAIVLNNKQLNFNINHYIE